MDRHCAIHETENVWSLALLVAHHVGQCALTRSRWGDHRHMMPKTVTDIFHSFAQRERSQEHMWGGNDVRNIFILFSFP